MKRFTAILTLCIGIGCSSTKNAAMNTFNLNGKWIPVNQMMNGTALPSEAFTGYELKLKDSTYAYTNHDKGIAKYANGKMDVYGKQGVNTGKHFTAIYKIENGDLVICYDLSGKAYPQSFETAGKPGLFLSVFERKNAE